MNDVIFTLDSISGRKKYSVTRWNLLRASLHTCFFYLFIYFYIRFLQMEPITCDMMPKAPPSTFRVFLLFKMIRLSRIVTIRLLLMLRHLCNGVVGAQTSKKISLNQVHLDSQPALLRT
jgi:hypothetical protein